MKSIVVVAAVALVAGGARARDRAEWSDLPGMDEAFEAFDDLDLGGDLLADNRGSDEDDEDLPPRGRHDGDSGRSHWFEKLPQRDRAQRALEKADRARDRLNERADRERERADRDSGRDLRSAENDALPPRGDHDRLPGDHAPAHVFRFGQGDHVEEEQQDADGTPRGVTGRAEGHGSASLPVKGPVNFRLRAQSGDVEVVAGDKPQVVVSLRDAPAEDLEILAFGDHVEPRFRGRHPQLRRGKLHVELPRGSQLDLVSMSGDVQVRGVGGEVRIRTMSGDVKLAGIARADVQSISGDVSIEGAAGPVRLRTVSGHAVLAMTGAAPQLDFQSTSGNLDWTGACGKDCRLSAETMSGDLNLDVDPKSSFELSYSSHSGELRDEVELAVKHAPKRKHGLPGGWLEATYGAGEGVIEADAFSGSLRLRKK